MLTILEQRIFDRLFAAPLLRVHAAVDDKTHAAEHGVVQLPDQSPRIVVVHAHRRERRPLEEGRAGIEQCPHPLARQELAAGEMALAALLALAASAAAADKPTLTIYTYDAFAADYGPGPALKAGFEKTCGCTVNFVATDSSMRSDAKAGPSSYMVSSGRPGSDCNAFVRMESASIA